jgi:hypothetical protein
MHLHARECTNSRSAHSDGSMMASMVHCGHHCILQRQQHRRHAMTQWIHTCATVQNATASRHMPVPGTTTATSSTKLGMASQPTITADLPPHIMHHLGAHTLWPTSLPASQRPHHPLRQSGKLQSDPLADLRLFHVHRCISALVGSDSAQACLQSREPSNKYSTAQQPIGCNGWKECIQWAPKLAQQASSALACREACQCCVALQASEATPAAQSSLLITIHMHIEAPALMYIEAHQVQPPRTLLYTTQPRFEAGGRPVQRKLLRQRQWTARRIICYQAT